MFLEGFGPQILLGTLATTYRHKWGISPTQPDVYHLF